MTINNEQQLAQLLRNAADAHHEYEKQTGKPDATLVHSRFGRVSNASRLEQLNVSSLLLRKSPRR